MLNRKISSRGVLFTNEYKDSVYLINGDEKIFLCDTNEGPKPMEAILNYLGQQLEEKELIIFNSHSDWDHTWGNCAFSGHTIISQQACKEVMVEKGEFFLKVLRKFHDGNLQLKLPNLTFEQRLTFPEEKIEFIHTPGHTIGSAICFDHKDSVIYVGDLIESPIPVLNHSDLGQYLETLQFIKGLSAETVVTTHSGIVDNQLIDQNIDYLQKMISGREIELEDEHSRKVHDFNLKNMLLLANDKKVRELQGEEFDFQTYRKKLWEYIINKIDTPDDYEYWDLRIVDYQELKKIIDRYIIE